MPYTHIRISRPSLEFVVPREQVEQYRRSTSLSFDHRLGVYEVTAADGITLRDESHITHYFRYRTQFQARPIELEEPSTVLNYRRIVCEPALLLAAWERNEIAPQGGFLWYNFGREFVTVGHTEDDFPHVVEPGQSFYTANDPQIRAVDRLALLANEYMVRQDNNTWRNSSDLVVMVGNESIQPNETFHALFSTGVSTARAPRVPVAPLRVVDRDLLASALRQGLLSQEGPDGVIYRNAARVPVQINGTYSVQPGEAFYGVFEDGPLPTNEPMADLTEHIRRMIASAPPEEFNVIALGNGNYKVEFMVTACSVSPVARSRYDVLGDFLV